MRGHPQNRRIHCRTMALSIAALLIPAVAWPQGGETTSITTNPAGVPVTIAEGQILTLQHNADPAATILSRRWSLLDENMELVAGNGTVADPIFEWISFSDENPINVSAEFGPIIQIRIFVQGIYFIRLECPGATVPTEKIASSGDPGFVEAGQSLTLSAPGFGYDYQWLKDGIEIPGATGPALNFASLDTADAGRYTLVYNDGYSESVVQTEPFTLAVLAEGSLPALSSFGLGAAICLVLAFGILCLINGRPARWR